MTQISLNWSVPSVDRVRVSKQCAALLARLEKGSATNVELMIELRILNLTARASELRQAGYDVRATRIDGGCWRYDLVTK